MAERKNDLANKRRENDWKDSSPKDRSQRIARAAAQDRLAWAWAQGAASEADTYDSTFGGLCPLGRSGRAGPIDFDVFSEDMKQRWIILSSSCLALICCLAMLASAWYVHTWVDPEMFPFFGGGSAARGSQGSGGGAGSPVLPPSPGVGGGNNPCKRYCGPRFFVGGAYMALHNDLQSASIPSGVGYWLHPMGFNAAQPIMPAVLRRFGTAQYAYEADLDDWTSGANPAQTTNPGMWGSMLNAAAGSPTAWKCALFAAWAKSGDIASGACIPKYQGLFSKIRAWGCEQCFVFWSPPSEPSVAYQAMRSRPWQKILSEAGATGAMVDHPAGRADCVDVSIDFLRVAKSMGLTTAWVFNGADSPAATASMVKRVRAAVAVDVWAQDNFHAGVSGQGNSWATVLPQLQATMQGA